MKVLINASFKALRVGKYVRADEEASEFIFDDKDADSLSVATLLEIAAANKIEAKKDKKDIVIKTVSKGIKAMDLPEMSEKPESEVVAEIVKTGVAEEKSDDEMLIAIVQAGIKFKKAGRLFNQAMTEGGYRVSAKDRRTSVREILVADEFQPEEFSEVSAMIAKIVEKVNDTTTSQAMSCIRAYAKEFELVIPKPPKKARGGFKTLVQNFLLENLDATKEEFTEFCTSNKKDEKAVERMWPNIVWMQSCVEKARAE